MRKIFLFSAVLSLFLLVPASITRAQVTKTLNGVVRYESGISKTTFETPNGNIVTSLPQSMTGTIITGTVVAEPAGKTEKEKSRNLQELVKLVVNLDGQKIPVTATPTNFDWLTHLDRQQRTPIELLNVSGNKLAELSLPPVISAPATVAVQTGIVPHLTTPSNVLVKGDLLNVYTNQQFSPGEKFVLTDSKGQQFILNPITRSSEQAVMSMPDEVSPGKCSVSRQVGNQPASSAGVANFNLIDIKLTSPNTNLRPGQGSFVLATIGWGDSRDQVTFDIWGGFSVDLRNLEPNTVTMEGGNLQRISFPLSENSQDPTAWQIRRTITGIKPGTFSVSATLHEDYTTSNDPFRPQLNVLKTREDFTSWAIALTKDLKQYASVQNNDGMGQAVKANTQRAIENMPVCKSPEQLDECKAVIYSLIQPLNVPMGAANTWLSSYEAFKTSVASAVSGLPDNTILTDWDIVRNGLDFLERLSYSSNDPSVTQEIANARQLVNTIGEAGNTKENLNQLIQALSTLSSKPDEKHAFMQGPDESKYVGAYTKHADRQGPDYSRYLSMETHVHQAAKRSDESKYLHVFDKHATEKGPDESRHVSIANEHIAEEGPEKSRYIYKVYKRHAAEVGPDNSKYFDTRIYKHGDKEGPDKSRYVLQSYVHAEIEGPDKSKYVDPNNKHEIDGPYKSRHLFMRTKAGTEVPDPSKNVATKFNIHADIEGPDKSIDIPYKWDHEGREVPSKSKYKPPYQEHEYREGPDKSTYVKKDHEHAGEGIPDKSKRYPEGSKHEDMEGPDKSKRIPVSWNHVESEGPDKSKWIPESWKHVASEGPNKSKRYEDWEFFHADKEGPDQSKLIGWKYYHIDKEGPDKSKYIEKYLPHAIHGDKEGPDKSKTLLHKYIGKNRSEYFPEKPPIHIDNGPNKSVYRKQ